MGLEWQDYKGVTMIPTFIKLINFNLFATYNGYMSAITFCMQKEV